MAVGGGLFLLAVMIGVMFWMSREREEDSGDDEGDTDIGVKCRVQDSVREENMDTGET